MRKGYSPKLRHVSRTHKLDLGVVKEAIDNQGVKLEHVETTKQCADIFTKDLPPHAWPHALNLIGMRPLDSEGVAVVGPLTAAASTSEMDEDLIDPKQNSKTKTCGGLTACAIIDDVVGPDSPSVISDPLDDQSDYMVSQSAHIVKAALASKPSCKKSRPSGKLPGWGKLIELCTDKNSTLGAAAKHFSKVEVIRVTVDHDFGDPETVQQILDMIELNPGISIHASLECTAWSTWQEMAVHKYGEPYFIELQKRRQRSIKMIKSFIMLAERAFALGGEVSLEWPRSCRGWLIPELLAFIARWNLFSTTVDGCSLGMTNKDNEPILKRWRFIISSGRMYTALSKFSCEHPKGFKHAEIQGSLTPQTAYYPPKLCNAMLSALFGWYEFSPAMPCIASQCCEHREKDITSTTPVDCHLDQPAREGVSLLTRGLVHQLLSWKQTRCDPKAVQAVKDEVNSLAEIGTWDETTACSKDKLIQWAQDTGTKIYVGEGLGICSIKNPELPDSDTRRKYKGRSCYRTPTARDEGGAIAIFQEMASRPTTIVSLNVAIAYGLFAGHKTSVADAIKAYVQSKLNSAVPTYIEIPKHLCPDKFKHLDKPCFRFVRALYGHPEAGGHWENHLTKIILAMGGTPITNHPSCFWFNDTKLFLIVYVDDLLLSGPEEAHDDFWSKLSGEVNIEPPEDLDRYLGRHHSFEDFKRLDVNILEAFDSPVVV